MVTWPSGKARVCKTLIHQFKSGRHLQKIPGNFGSRDFLFLRLFPISLLALSVTYGDIFPRSGGSLSSKGEPLAKSVTLQLNRKVCRSAALSQKAALQMPFTFTTPPVKMQCRSVRRRSGIALLKIILPLNTAGAKRRPFQIVPLRTSAASGTTPRPRGWSRKPPRSQSRTLHSSAPGPPYRSAPVPSGPGHGHR